MKFNILRIVYLFIVTLLLNTSIALGINIVKDSELEEVIGEIVQPIFNAAHTPNLKIYVIKDETPNAFVISGNEIFIHSGLIIQHPNPDVLRGVVAHELGHIIGHHHLQQELAVANIYKQALLASTTLGLAILLGENAWTDNLALGPFLGMHMAERKILSHSRSLESSADQVALKLLETSKHSSVGLLEFFNKMHIQAEMSNMNAYDRTHPLSRDRILVIKSFSRRSKYPESQNTPELIARYKRAATKLAAFTLKAEDVNNIQYINQDPALKLYADTIIYYRKGNFNNAINAANKLVMSNPNNAFYHELKGQILFEAQKKSALAEYEIALKIRPNDQMIKLGRAIVGINTYADKPFSMTPFYRDLKAVKKADPENILALFYLAKYYDLRNMPGQSALNSAIINLKFNKIKEAKILAKEALKHLEPKKPLWYQAKDIIDMY